MPTNKDDKKTALTITLNHVVVAHGFAKLSMNRLASLAGVSRATLYLYFSNKDEIVDAAIGRHLQFIAANTLSTVDPSPAQYVRTRINTLLLLGSMSPVLHNDLRAARPDLAAKLNSGYRNFQAGIITQLETDMAASVITDTTHATTLYQQDHLFVRSVITSLTDDSIDTVAAQAVLTSYLTGAVRGTLRDPTATAAAFADNADFISTIWGEMQATYR
ncbi:TetR/AcrR family transcriptional regulator [Lacticaseibacillus pantheris]